MAKLYFRYGAMNSSKSALLLTAAYNYEERDQRPIIVKPGVDTKAGTAVSSRIGIERDVDVLLGADDSLVEAIAGVAPLDQIDAVFVDEAQFLTPKQADEAFTLAVTGGIPVLCYGLRTDFLGNLFPGSAALLALADSLIELKAVCDCGRKATMNLRVDSEGHAVASGAQTEVGGNDRYVALCRKHFFERLRESEARQLSLAIAR